MFHRGIFTSLAVLLIAGPAVAADPADTCAAAKISEAGKYANCLLRAESKAIKKGFSPDFAKCDQRYDKKWAKIEQKGGLACPTSGDASSIQDNIIADCDALAGRLSGGGPVGNGEIRTERTIASITSADAPRHIAVNDGYGNPMNFTAASDGTCVEVSVDPSGDGIWVDALADLCEEDITLTSDANVTKTLTVKVYDPEMMDIGGGLFIKYVNDYQFVWNDHATGGHVSGSFLAPQVPSGWHMLGHIALDHQSHDPPNNPLVGHPMIVVRADPSSDALAEATGPFNHIWTCSTGTHNVKVWTPNCPTGYVGLGFVARGYWDPDPVGATENIRCVKEEYTKPAIGVGDMIYHSSDTGTGMERMWFELGPPQSVAPDAGRVPLNPGTHLACSQFYNCTAGDLSKARYLLAPLEVMEKVDRSLREPSLDEFGELDPGSSRSYSEVRVPHTLLPIMDPEYVGSDEGSSEDDYNSYYADNAVENSPFYRLSRKEEYSVVGVSDCQMCSTETQIGVTYTTGYQAGTESTYSETYGLEVEAGLDASFKGIGMSSSVTFSTEFSWSSTYSELFSEGLEVEFDWTVPANTYAMALQVKTLWQARSEDDIDLRDFSAAAKKKHLKYVQWPP